MDKTNDNQSGLQCFWSNLKEHPKCVHGPTLLFEQCINNKFVKFYICAACRQRKLCPFYLEYGQTLTKSQEAKWIEKTKQYVSTFHRQKLFIDLHKILATSPSRRMYCHTCEKLFLLEDKNKHENHEFIEGLSDYQMSHPTEILKPATDCKKEAQYLFSEKSTKDIVNFLSKFEAEQVLCIGAPRIHEYITNNMDGKMSSLLLDLDGRFHNFYGSLNFCWYNLFNHYFLYKDSESVFKDFMTQSNGKNLYIVCDPPFGGRVEAIAQTLKTISDSYKKWNKLEDEPKVLFIFPYFMESIIQHKSSPPTFSGGMKNYKMVEYRVEYDNHPLFVKNDNEKKLGSPVRIFTNIPLKLFELPESDYKFCKKCDRWVTIANKHCKKCKSCTSKDGRAYKHCNTCQRCVKEFWIHCNDCNRCNTVEHKCGTAPVIHGFCNKCNQAGHTEKYCDEEIVGGSKRKNSSDESQPVPLKKRKGEKNNVKLNDNDSKLVVKKKNKKNKQPSNNIKKITPGIKNIVKGVKKDQEPNKKKKEKTFETEEHQSTFTENDNAEIDDTNKMKSSKKLKKSNDSLKSKIVKKKKKNVSKQKKNKIC